VEQQIKNPRLLKKAGSQKGVNMSKNFEAFLELDKKGMENQYIILVNGKIVANGVDIEKMLARVRNKYPKVTPFVAKIPDERMMVL
jgi:hypothetical protein